MSSTLLRLGLWVILLVVVMYVLQQTYEEAPFVDFFAPAMLEKALALGGALIAAGVVMRILERGAKVVVKNRCVVCKTPIEHGAIYCREHLRGVLSREDDRTHRTRVIRKG
jgi:predicted nucleic acid-binding Zn ribbon protein